jgi:hypothetical protein
VSERLTGALRRVFRETKRRLAYKSLYIKEILGDEDFDPMFHEMKCHGVGWWIGFFLGTLGAKVLRVIKVNTLEPLLKTLTPSQTYTW